MLRWVLRIQWRNSLKAGAGPLLCSWWNNADQPTVSGRDGSATPLTADPAWVVDNVCSLLLLLELGQRLSSCFEDEGIASSLSSMSHSICEGRLLPTWADILQLYLPTWRLADEKTTVESLDG